MEPQIRFCTSADGTRIAYAVFGEGPPLVLVYSFGATVSAEAENPAVRAAVERLAQERRVVVVTRRGIDPSQRDADDFSLEAQTADLKAVLDKNSGMTFAKLAGKMWDDVGAEVAAKVKASGKGTIAEISEEEKARWVEATQPVRDKWVEEMKGKNIDGAALIEEAKALIAKNSAG